MQSFEFLYASILLLLCSVACMAGSSVFTKTGYVLFIVLVTATLSIPLSSFFVKPHYIYEFDTVYSGLSLRTLRGNAFPNFTAGAAGSEQDSPESFQSIFGIFFPATAGIFAGASMSGDLKNPGKSIPKGTLSGLLMTFSCYSLVILAMAASIPRQLLYTDVHVLQTVNLSKYVIILGEMSTALFSSIVGIVGAAKVLQAIARDDIIPQLSIFKQGTKHGHEPIYAVIVTYIICQITLFLDINTIAGLVTVAFLLTFIVTNIACFLLKVGSAPNFRPSFHFFHWSTALVGGILSVATMFVVDGIYASVILAVMIGLFIIIHYITPPKSWGDVAQSLIYHQVRKYLLRLRQDHVKFWRPQILLLVDDPRQSWNLIHFCNSLKKGALYVLGHVVIMNNFQESYPDMQQLQNAWLEFRDISKVKAFVQMAAGPDIVWGIRNIVMAAGLGGMKPNVAVLGFFDLYSYKSAKPLIDVPEVNATKPSKPYAPLQFSYKYKGNIDSLPTDSFSHNSKMSVTEYVNVIEDLLAMQVNVAIARNFSNLDLPYSWIPKSSRDRRFIDLWPIQMSAHMFELNGEGPVSTTNFDTYTLILQLGAILHTVPAWRKSYNLRVMVFVEYQDDVEEERGRVKMLLDNLRIEAEVCVFCLSDGSVLAYETIVHGRPDVTGKVAQAMSTDSWWEELQEARDHLQSKGMISPGAPVPWRLLEDFIIHDDGPSCSLQQGLEWPYAESSGVNTNDSPVFVGNKGETDVNATGANATEGGYLNLKKRRQTFTEVHKIGMSFSMQTSCLTDEDVRYLDTFDDDNNDELEGVYTSQSDGTVVAGATGAVVGSPSKTSLASKKSKTNNSDSFSSVSTVYKSLSGDYLDHVTGDDNNINMDVERIAGFYNDTSRSNEMSMRSRMSNPNLSFTSTPSRRRPLPNFSGRTIPHAEILDDEGENQKTIQFANQSASTKNRVSQTSIGRVSSQAEGDVMSSITSEEQRSASPSFEAVAADSTSTLHRTATNKSTATGRSVLSFNDLPARAQHIILNDLMKNVSQNAVVVLATLPAPMVNTWQSEEDSIAYLEELDLWCQDLPPILLVHSMSVTVTMAL